MNKIILLIEDNPLLSGMYKTALEKSGFEVEVSHDGESGLKLMRDTKPSGVVLDLLMPGMNGFTVLEKMKEDKEIADTKVIVLTSDTKPEDLERARSLGAIECLIKSELTLADITEKISSYFK